MSAGTRLSEGSRGLASAGVQVPRAGLQRPSVRAMRERVVTSFFVVLPLFFARCWRFLLRTDGRDWVFLLPGTFFRLPVFRLRLAGARGVRGRWYTAVLRPVATASMVSSSREDMRCLGTC